MGLTSGYLQRLLASLPGAAAIYVIEDGVLTMPYYSEGLPKMMGFTRDEYDSRIAGDNMNLVMEQDHDFVKTTIAHALQSNQDVNCSYRVYQGKDYRWMNVQGRLIGKLGNWPVLLAIFCDISQETNIHEQILDQSGDAVYVCDNKTRELFYMNQQAKNLWRIDGDYFGQTCYKMLRGFDKPCSWCPIGSMPDGTSSLYRMGGPGNSAHLHIDYRTLSWHGRASLCATVKDSTEEDETREELSKTQTELEEIVNNVPSGIGIFDLKGDVINLRYLNDGYYRMLHTTRAERQRFAGKNTTDALCPDDVPALLAEAHRSIRNNDLCHQQFRVLGADGHYRWVSISATHKALSNDIERFYAAYFDIDELILAQKTAERQLAEEKLKMRSLQGDILAASCFNVTQDNNIELNNDDNLRYSAVQDDSIEQQAEDVSHRIAGQKWETKNVLLSAAEQIPDSTQRRTFIGTCSHMGLMEAYERGDREISLEYRRNTGKGLIWVRTRIALLPDPQTGDVLAFFYTIDINERKLEQLISRRVIEDDYEFIAFIDATTKKIHLLAPLGTRDEMTPEDRSLHDTALMNAVLPFVDEDDREDMRRSISLDNVLEQLKHSPEYLYAFTITDSDGHRMRKQLRYAYLDQTRDSIFATGADITESTRQEQEQRDKLMAALRGAETANAAKSDFLARMSHDIRTPLNGVMGLTKLALDEQDPAAMHDYLSKIDESSEFLLSLVNDILDMSKVESGTLELHPAIYRYCDFRRYIMSVIKPLCDSKGITFTMTDSERKPSLLIDKLRLNQIFFNLLSNAVKFTPEGGHIWFQIHNLSNADGKSRIECIVRDDGIGMSEDFQSHLFEPFSQEHTAMSDSRSGTGLGLSIVKQLVDLMGGTISVNSVIGQGTSFTVRLKVLLATDAKASEDQAEAASSIAGLRILAAEDNAINAEIVERLLRKQGAEVTIADNGQKAVQLFSESEVHHFDAVLMDVRMPVMDGLQATRAIRMLPRPDAQQTPIIAMTANAFDDDVKACLAAGMDAHIAKPVDPQSLFRSLAKQTARRSGLGE